MIHKRYRLGESSIHGTGIFAAENISQGDLIYTVDPEKDTNISAETFASLSAEKQEYIRRYGYWFKPNRVWHVDADDIRYINHSSDANTTQDFSRPEHPLVAMRDIRVGEELTQNHLEFKTVEDLLEMGIPLENI